MGRRESLFFPKSEEADENGPKRESVLPKIRSGGRKWEEVKASSPQNKKRQPKMGRSKSKFVPKLKVAAENGKK